jgi:hypothetical protein
VLNEFAAIDHDGPNPGAALVLLGLLRTEQDHYVLFDEAARQYPHLEPALRWLNSDSILNEGMSRPLGNLRQAKLQDYFYYDSRVGRIDIHDVQLIYYLSNMDWKEFARRAGYWSEIRGNRVRVRRLNQRRPRKPAPHPADMTPSSSEHPPMTNRADVERALPHVTPSGLDPDPATRLVNFLSEIPAFSDPANRSILLKGLPKGLSGTISRHPAAWTDLHNIVEAALGMGRLPGRGTLAIHKLLDNSLKFIEGTQHEPELNDLRRLFTA